MQIESAANDLRRSARSACSSPRHGTRKSASLQTDAKVSDTGSSASAPTSADEDTTSEEIPLSMHIASLVLHNVGASSRMAPLARFSARGPLSPTSSPRFTAEDSSVVDDNRPVKAALAALPTIDDDRILGPKAPRAQPSMLHKGRQKLTLLLSPRSKKSSGCPKTRLSKSGEKSLRTKLLNGREVPSTPRAQSAPASPRTNQGPTVIFVNRTILAEPEEPSTRGRSQTFSMGCNDAPPNFVDQFAKSLRSFESCGASSDSSTDVDSGSGAESDRKQKKRHSMFLKAVSGGSTKHGASATIEFDDVTRQPIVRVRSTSSVDELKHRLRAEAAAADKETNKSSLSHSARDTGSCASEKSSDDNSGGMNRLLRSASKRRASLSSSMKLGNTYTQIRYNPCPLGLSPWQTFLVPNDQINAALRTHLERASASDVANSPYRLCDCSPDCQDHAPPDATAKLFAIFLVDPNMSTPPSMQAILAGLLTSYHRNHHSLRQGEWARNYTVTQQGQTNFSETPVTYSYSFKMFV